MQHSIRTTRALGRDRNLIYVNLNLVRPTKVSSYYAVLGSVIACNNSKWTKVLTVYMSKLEIHLSLRNFGWAQIILRELYLFCMNA